MRSSRVITFFLLLVATGLSSPAWSQGAADAAAVRRDAAAAFDEGVRRFEAAQFADAAHAFVRAHLIVASAEALRNALVAAGRAGDDLMVATIADRMLADLADDAATTRLAREAKASVLPRLARLDLQCVRAPCTLRVDGIEVASGISLVLPGTHVVESSVPGGRERREEHLSCVAGATYRLVVDPAVPDAPIVLVAPGAPQRAEPRLPETAAGLPPGTFFAGVGLTAVLVGVTTASGIDALAAREDLPSEPSQAANDDVLSRAQRTDVLLAVTAASALLTMALGLLLVDWSDDQAVSRIAPVSSSPGAMVVGGAF